MANSLTGDYEGVCQIAVRQINGLLGTIHQNAAVQGMALNMVHSTTLRIGDSPRRSPEVDLFGNWLIEYLRVNPGSGLNDVRALLTESAPPGAARMLSEAFVEFDRSWAVPYPPGVEVVRGIGKVQISSVTIAVPEDSSSEVIVHARVRAHYYPDPETTELPKPIHGDVRAVFQVQKVRSPFGTKLLIQTSPQQSAIQFIALPEAELNANDESRIAVEIRRVLRESLTLAPVDLPADFPFADFKGLRVGASQVIALPFQLSGADLPANGLPSLTQSFIGSSGFAFAVGKDYVSGLIDIEAIGQQIRNHPIVFEFWFFGRRTLTYRLRFSSGPMLTFKNGGIEISGRVEAETNVRWAPNGFVSFKQSIRLALDPQTQTIRLERAGESIVDESWFIPHSRAVDAVESQIDSALSANVYAIGRIFADVKNKLLNTLRTVDRLATVSFTAVEVTSDGVIVRGEIGSGERRAPIVDMEETHRGGALTAFQSWIPAGRIDRFIWSWVERAGRGSSIVPGTERSVTDEHRFILPKPKGIELGQICLRIEGTRIMPNGYEAHIASKTFCQISEPEVAIHAPSWWGPVTLPIWRPNASETIALSDAIAGHVSVQRDMPGKEAFSRNTLVYFANERSTKPLDALKAALTGVPNGFALMIIVVLPTGAFYSSRRKVEERLASTFEDIRTPVHLTEDNEGGWTSMFAVARTPSVYLINARSEFVWKYEGEPDPAKLAAALHQHLAPTPTSQFRPLQLAVSLGDSVPDFYFEDHRGHNFTLHRFRGRDLLLNFWQSWSAPCLTELARLQRLFQASKEMLPIIAFHGGKNKKELDDIQKRLEISFPLVQDSQQRISRRYGVRCWPTTITVGAEGCVEHIQFGIEHR